MIPASHLKSLQALELALREGSLNGAAGKLGITPAAVGQRIRALENYLGNDLLLRGRSGLKPTAELEQAMSDLHSAFSALDRVTQSLDFQRASEIHIVADPDWAELWLAPRLEEFRALYPKILFCINGAGDVALRLGAPDIRVNYGPDDGEPLFQDILLPVTGPDNPRRIADWDPVMQMEGMPLLHLKSHRDSDDYPGWVEWFQTFGQRESGPDRGVHYQNARHALEAVRENVGFLVCGLSLILNDLERQSIVLPFPISQHLKAPFTYRMKMRSDVEARPQVQRFITWLREAARKTQHEIAAMTS